LGRAEQAQDNLLSLSSFPDRKEKISFLEEKCLPELLTQHSFSASATCGQEATELGPACVVQRREAAKWLQDGFCHLLSSPLTPSPSTLE